MRTHCFLKGDVELTVGAVKKFITAECHLAEFCSSFCLFLVHVLQSKYVPL